MLRLPGARCVVMVLGLATIAPLHAQAQDTPSLEVLQAVARVLNKQTPMMVDTDTELSNVEAEAGAIVYYYRLVRVTASAIPVDRLKAFAQPAVTEQVCGNPGTRQHLLDRGVVMRYIYLDKDGQFVLSFDATAADCART